MSNNFLLPNPNVSGSIVDKDGVPTGFTSAISTINSTNIDVYTGGISFIPTVDQSNWLLADYNAAVDSVVEFTIRLNQLNPMSAWNTGFIAGLIIGTDDLIYLRLGLEKRADGFMYVVFTSKQTGRANLYVDHASSNQTSNLYGENSITFRVFVKNNQTINRIEYSYSGGTSWNTLLSSATTFNSTIKNAVFKASSKIGVYSQVTTFQPLYFQVEQLEVYYGDNYIDVRNEAGSNSIDTSISVSSTLELTNGNNPPTEISGTAAELSIYGEITLTVLNQALRNTSTVLIDFFNPDPLYLPEDINFDYTSETFPGTLKNSGFVTVLNNNYEPSWITVVDNSLQILPHKGGLFGSQTIKNVIQTPFKPNFSCIISTSIKMESYQFLDNGFQVGMVFGDFERMYKLALMRVSLNNWQVELWKRESGVNTTLQSWAIASSIGSTELTLALIIRGNEVIPCFKFNIQDSVTEGNPQALGTIKPDVGVYALNPTNVASQNVNKVVKFNNFKVKYIEVPLAFNDLPNRRNTANITIKASSLLGLNQVTYSSTNTNILTLKSGIGLTFTNPPEYIYPENKEHGNLQIKTPNLNEVPLFQADTVLSSNSIQADLHISTEVDLGFEQLDEIEARSTSEGNLNFTSTLTIDVANVPPEASQNFNLIYKGTLNYYGQSIQVNNSQALMLQLFPDVLDISQYSSYNVTKHNEMSNLFQYDDPKFFNGVATIERLEDSSIVSRDKFGNILKD